MDTKTGWVIRTASPFKRKDGTTVTNVFWWYGPNHGWGTTWGSPDLAKTFPTRTQAEEAHANIYGRGWRTDRLRSETKNAQRYTDAVAEYEERVHRIRANA